MTISTEKLNKALNGSGFIAALDQSGGSTPKALAMYGVAETEYSCEEEMFDKVHEMRTRIMTNPAFTGDKILGAILFENTMDRTVEGKATASYLWEEKGILPILKVDKGLADEANGVQLMKPMPDLDSLLEKANQNEIFGTKMRSVIKHANAEAIAEVVAQQFDIGKRIISYGMVPIIEPEVDINSASKQEAENILLSELMKNLDALESDQKVMLKLTLPEESNLYAPCVAHDQIVRVVALSGGYSREEANRRLADNAGMIASFSRALSEGLSVQQSDDEYKETLSSSIEEIVAASAT